LSSPSLFEDFAPGQSRWLEFEGFAFEVRYASPIEQQRFRNTLQSKGITRKDEVLPAAGREAAYFEAMAEKYVIGWRGLLPHPRGGDSYDLDSLPYSAKDMAKLLSYRGDVFERLVQTIGDADSFFGRNGHAQI